MRVYPGTTVDYEFAELGTLGYTGTLNDRQFAALRAEGLTGALPDMFGQFDGTLGGGGAPDYEAEVQAILSGTTGFALDPSDTATMWLESTKVTQVSSPADPVGAIESKYGTTTYTFAIATAGQRPAWNGAGAMVFDGVDDRIDVAASYAYTNNIPGVTYTKRVSAAALAGSFFGISTTAGATVRVQLGVGGTGEVILAVRRLDADSANTFTSAGGIIATATDYTVTITIDYAGTGGIEVFVDGVSVLTGTLANAPGNTSATNHVRHRMGMGANSGLCNMEDGRSVFLPRVATAGEIASFEGYVEEVPL